ncbi:right-handed parallel beta-helix repeat-containing protein [Candidatus Albibeggiatoa sp. nov. NOAA]|uniref:right-handed parallel beta-helix repeat-containing protein n=1 Tax=Candidatus Albibeggiatoa sp. nov. NOAA TaxID=3162724 RepID=UPI00330238D3|nr:right-handed parallel beta-helix repeat-containing protein [Thiotrichaceae bacterium]
MTRIKRLILLCGLFLFSNLAWSQTFYLSNQGSDTADGLSPQTAWQHLSRLNTALRDQQIQAGDSVLFERGSVFYGEIFSDRVKGDPNQRVTFSDYGDTLAALPKITGNVPINQWTATTINGKSTCVADSGNLQDLDAEKGQYGSYNINDMIAGKVQTTPTYLYFDGQLQDLARYPNRGQFLFMGDNTKGKIILDPELNTVPQRAKWVGAIAVTRDSNWTYTQSPVASINHDSLTLEHSILESLAPNNGYFLQGKLAGLDAPHEWFLDAAARKIYFTPPASIRCDQLDNRVQVTVFERAMSVHQYTTIENLHFDGYSDRILHLNSRSAQIYLKNNIFTRSLKAAFGSGTTEVVITGNVFRDILDSALRFWPTQQTTIEDNLFLNIGLSPQAAGEYNAILLGANEPETSHSHRIVNNHIKNVGYSGIVFRVGSNQAGKESIIERNIIEHALSTLADGGSIYLEDSNGVLIRDNLLLNAYGDKASWKRGQGFFPQTAFAFGFALYTSNNHNSQYLNNTVINHDDGFHATGSVRNNILKNNTFYGNREQQAKMGMGKATDNLGYQVTHNIFYNTDPIQYSLRQNAPQKAWHYGQFDYNYYNHPYNNNFYALGGKSNEAENFYYAGVQLYRWTDQEPYNYFYNFNGWQQLDGNDQHSKTDLQKWSVIKIDDILYEMDSPITGNLIKNADFETGISPWEVSGGQIETTTQLDGQALKVINSHQSYFVRVNNGEPLPLQQDGYYMLRFSIKREAEANIQVGIYNRVNQYSSKPALSRVYRLPSGKKRFDYQYLFKMQAISEDMRLFFYMEQDDPDYWLDNVSLQQVNLRPAMPATERSKIFINPYPEARQYNLGGLPYRDLDGNTVSGKIEVAPFSSQILVRTDASNKRPAALSAPQLRLTQKLRTVVLGWEAIANATNYRLYYAQNAEQINFIDVGTLTHGIFDLPANTKLYVAIQAMNEMGNSALSNVEYIDLQ